jgi:hypothetical protein
MAPQSRLSVSGSRTCPRRVWMPLRRSKAHHVAGRCALHHNAGHYEQAFPCSVAASVDHATAPDIPDINLKHLPSTRNFAAMRTVL